MHNLSDLKFLFRDEVPKVFFELDFCSMKKLVADLAKPVNERDVCRLLDSLILMYLIIFEGNQESASAGKRFSSNYIMILYILSKFVLCSKLESEREIERERVTKTLQWYLAREHYIRKVLPFHGLHTRRAEKVKVSSNFDYISKGRNFKEIVK